MTNATLVRQFANARGDLLHPSYSMTPIDMMFSTLFAPSGEIWQAYATVSDLYWYSLLCVDVVSPYDLMLVHLWPLSQQNLVTQTYVIASIAGASNGSQLNTFGAIMEADSVFQVSTPSPAGAEHGFVIYLVVPLGPSGYSC
jgi:hypothetical protein